VTAVADIAKGARRAIALASALVVPVAAGAQPPAAEPASQKTFFAAIARGQFAEAAAMIKGDVRVLPAEVAGVGSASLRPAEFIDRVRDCYLRSFYKKDGEPGVLAAWMCPLTPSATNPNQSWVILVQVVFEGDRVRLSDYFQRDSTRPAPPPNLRPAN
jgi:hypothetical protein